MEYGSTLVNFLPKAKKLLLQFIKIFLQLGFCKDLMHFLMYFESRKKAAISSLIVADLIVCTQTYLLFNYQFEYLMRRSLHILFKRSRGFL